MNRNNILIEALYDFKCTRRSILFGIFIVLTIVGLIVYQFIPLSELKYVSSIKDLFSLPVEWVSRALPSSMAYKTAFYFNFVQLLFVVAFVADDSRAARSRALEPLRVRPQGNGEIVAGNFLGKLFLFTLAGVIVFAISILIHVVLYPHSFKLSIYFFYWFTLTFPALVYFLGISSLVTRLLRHPGFSMILLLSLLGTLVYAGAGWFNGLLDPCARYTPNVFSDFTGHVEPGNYLLQRGFTLLAGFGFLVLSVIPYPRIPNHVLVLKRNLPVACILFLLAGALAVAYGSRYGSTGDHREVCKRVYAEHGKLLPARVTRQDLRVTELENGGISVNSRTRVTNRASTVVPLVLYLNPGLEVNTLKLDGQAVSFRRDHQALLLDKALHPGETVELTMDYAGRVDNDICFLDTDPGRYVSPSVNVIDIYHFGYTPAFCEKGYKLLTPECLWYPVCVPPYGESGIRDVNFSRYSLRVEHDPRLVAISQGDRVEEAKGVTAFSFHHDMAGISLCVGDYRKREITIDSTRLALYYLPGHEYLLEDYDCPKEKLVERLKHVKDVDGDHECVQSSTFKKNRRRDVNFYDPTQEYPYRWLTLLEVPCGFHCFPGLMQLTGERVQGGIAFIPEKAYSINKYPSRICEIVPEKEVGAILKLEEEIKMIVGEGCCDVKPLFRGKTMSIFSREYPMMHDVLIEAVRGGFDVMHASTIDEYPAVEYLSRKSLKDALSDRSLSPEKLDLIMDKKNQELHASIALRVGKNEFRQFYLDFLKGNLFKETTSEACFEQFYQTFGFRLDSLLACWYTTDHLPLLDIRDVRVIKITDAEIPYKLYCFKVFNRSDVPGLVKLDDYQGWIIPAREGREIRTRGKENDPEFMFGCSMEIPLAQNLPSVMELKMVDQGSETVDTTTGVFSVDSSAFRPNTDEIIVDNEDPGFRVVKAKNFISSLFQEAERQKEYCIFSTEDAWVSSIQQHFYGFPLRSACWKVANSGKQRVEWNVTLPREGRYEVFFYHVERFAGIIVGEKIFSHYYTVFDGREEHEVVLALNGHEAGVWVSLGVFDFSKNAKVTLSDRGKTGESEHVLVADAVKWVKVKE